MIELIKEKWDDLMKSVREEMDLSVSDISYKMWLMPLTPVAFENNTLTILYPGQEQGKKLIEERFRFIIQSVIEATFDMKCNLTFVTSYADSPAVIRPSGPFNQYNIKLNPRYTFDSFVVGASNRMAHAASIAVAESPGRIYNPLFIYGGVGLGKTHLMQSIAHYIMDNRPELRVLYVSSEKFTTDLIDSISTRDKGPAFREKYRNIDVLLIDDIQFIANKTATQEEIFHTFNTIYEAGKQIIFSSDRPPKDIDVLSERLRSRFSMGLSVDIDTPDYETRMAILRKKEESENYNIDNEVINYIASNIKSNIRELEGALTKIVAFSRLNNTEITLGLAEEALRDHISPENSDVITPEKIIRVVADHYGLSVSDIISDRRNKEISYPRQIAMYLCCTMTNASQDAIGQALGKKDHSTIIYGRNKITDDIKMKADIKNTVDVLKKKLSPGG